MSASAATAWFHCCHWVSCRCPATACMAHSLVPCLTSPCLWCTPSGLLSMFYELGHVSELHCALQLPALLRDQVRVPLNARFLPPASPSWSCFLCCHSHLKPPPPPPCFSLAISQGAWFSVLNSANALWKFGGCLGICYSWLIQAPSHCFCYSS